MKFFIWINLIIQPVVFIILMIVGCANDEYIYCILSVYPLGTFFVFFNKFTESKKSWDPKTTFAIGGAGVLREISHVINSDERDTSDTYKLKRIKDKIDELGEIFYPELAHLLDGPDIEISDARNKIPESETVDEIK